MEEPINKILLEVDDDIQCEWPSDFNWEKALDHVRKIKPKIEELLGCDLALDDSIQDASYFASLVILSYIPPDPNLYTAPGVERGGTYYTVIDISFSCFGNLTTIVIGDDYKDKFSDEQIISVGNLLNKNGFTYIPEKYLLEKYTGNNPYFPEATWGERYFSHL